MVHKIFEFFQEINPDKYFTFELTKEAKNIHLVTKENYQEFYGSLCDRQKKNLDSIDYKGDNGSYWLLYTPEGDVDKIVFGYDPEDIYSILAVIDRLPSSVSEVNLINLDSRIHKFLLAQLWANEQYIFDFYKKSTKHFVKLFIDSDLSREKLINAVRATIMGRHCVNFPAEDCTPEWMHIIFERTAEIYGAKFKAIIGEDLLDNNLNLIHAVGRGIAQEATQPRLLHIEYNKETNYPHLALVGKGVTFDTGGLHIKTGSYMDIMKKDMGGSACILALMTKIMANKLPVKLDVVIPLAENNVDANSFRAGDIFTAHNRKTVEITNTDAEGRLLLADALSYVSSQNPELIIDVATLTGAARTALGSDIPATYSTDDEVMKNLYEASRATSDLLWQLPLHKGYEAELKGTISDYVNSPASGMAGSITAALFLKEFISKKQKWVHFDSYCWNRSKKPACPQGGDVVPIRAIYHFLENHFVKH